jgi:hypothetical protein
MVASWTHDGPHAVARRPDRVRTRDGRETLDGSRMDAWCAGICRAITPVSAVATMRAYIAVIGMTAGLVATWAALVPFVA